MSSKSKVIGVEIGEGDVLQGERLARAEGDDDVRAVLRRGGDDFGETAVVVGVPKPTASSARRLKSIGS